MINQQMPLSSLQLIMQLAQNNPQMMAQMMANTGAQPPQVPATPQGNRATGVPAMGATPTAQAAGNPSGISSMAARVPMGQPQAPAAPDPAMAQLGASLANASQSTLAPGPETLPAPGAPQPLQATGSMDGAGVAQLMQMLMQAQQKPTDRLSLGRAISGA